MVEDGRGVWCRTSLMEDMSSRQKDALGWVVMAGKELNHGGAQVTREGSWGNRLGVLGFFRQLA